MLCVFFYRHSGLVVFCSPTRGFTPGYILSALRACWRAVVGRLKRLNASGADGGMGGVGAYALSEIPASFALLVL